MKEFSQRYLTEKRNEILENLSKLLSFPSVRAEGQPKYPFGKPIDDALQFMLELSRQKGYRIQNENGYYGYGEIGQGEDLVTLLVHLDVVPAEGEWSSAPFEMQRTGGKLIGRGVLDDKGPAIACLYAMDMLQRDYERRGKRLNSRVRLVFGVDEESGWEDMKKYAAKEELPTCGFTADSDFPVGILSLELSIPNQEKFLADIRAGMVVNMVPGKCVVNMSDGTQKQFDGKEAHACEAEKGDNAIKNCMLAFSEQKMDSPLLAFWQTYIGNEPNGKCLGCDIRDEISGALSMNVGTIRMDPDAIHLGIDIRFPVTYDAETVENMIRKRLQGSMTSVRRVACNPPLYIPLEHPLVQTLMTCFYECTGIEAAPVVTGGGTYARALPGIAAFGPVFPGRACTEHQPNEYILEQDFFAMIEIYYRALVKLTE